MYCLDNKYIINIVLRLGGVRTLDSYMRLATYDEGMKPAAGLFFIPFYRARF